MFLAMRKTQDIPETPERQIFFLYHTPQKPDIIVLSIRSKLHYKIRDMKAEDKGQLFGGFIGLIIGSIIVYLLWGFSSPGGIVMLFGFGIGGIIGYKLFKKKK